MLRIVTDKHQLEARLVSRNIHVNGELIVKPLSPRESGM